MSFTITDLIRVSNALSPNKSRDAQRLRRKFELEIQYQKTIAPFMRQREAILRAASIDETAHAKLKELNQYLSEASIDRPHEFGGAMCHRDFEAQNIVRRAAYLIEKAEK